MYNLATFLRAWQTQNVERLAAVTVADQRDTRERRSENNTGLNTRQHRHNNPGDGGFPGRSWHKGIGSAAEQKRHNQSVLGFCRNGRAAELREERRQMMMFAHKYLNLRFLSEFRSQSLEECARRANKDRSSDKCLLYAAVRKKMNQMEFWKTQKMISEESFVYVANYWDRSCSTSLQSTSSAWTIAEQRPAAASMWRRRWRGRRLRWRPHSWTGKLDGKNLKFPGIHSVMIMSQGKAQEIPQKAMRGGRGRRLRYGGAVLGYRQTARVFHSDGASRRTNARKVVLLTGEMKC